MKNDNQKKRLTDKEEELMQLLWEHGPMPVSQLLELYPEPRPHFNTVSTVIRRLEAKGFVNHEVAGGAYRYYAVAKMEDFRKSSFSRFIKSYFKGSYYGAVSAVVADVKISADELRELLDLVERKSSVRKNGQTD